MWVYIVTLLMATNVSIPCPNRVEFCSIKHTQRVENPVRKYNYCQREDAWGAYRQFDDAVWNEDTEHYYYNRKRIARLDYNAVDIDSIYIIK